MTGLDKIIEHIKQDSIAASDQIIADAKAQADECMAQARKECEAGQNAQKAKTEAEINLTLQRGESAAALQKRKMLLKAKQDIIGNVLEYAKDALIKLPEKEYFDNIIKMVKKYSIKQSGEILFSPSDLARLPKDFEAGLKGTELTVSKQTRNIDGGFVLLYGDIEENCSFDALFSAAKDTLQDKIHNLLFE